MKKILSVDKLSVTYPAFELKDVSFQLYQGEIVGLIGENGAGKSTTMKAIMGMVDIAKGMVEYKGKVILNNDISNFRQSVGYVGDAELYYAKVKVKRVLSFLSDIYEKWDNPIMEEYLKKFNIDTEKKIIELSTGMRVKLEIVMALAHTAEIYLLDEPTSGLDPIVRRDVLNIIRKLAKEDGKAVLFSSHITSDIEKIADRVICMNAGKVIADENIDDLMKKYAKQFNRRESVTIEDILFYLKSKEAGL